MTYDSVFKRVEKKYRLDAADRRAVEAAARPFMAVDAYGRSRITSLYLDTPERAAIARSVEKPLYKEKLRLRAYGAVPGAVLMEAFCGAPLVRNGAAPLSDDEVEARVARALAVVGAAGSGAGDGWPAGGSGPAPAGDAQGSVGAGVSGAVSGVAEGARPGAAGAVGPSAAEILGGAWPVFFGIKKKYRGIVYKRRLALSLPAALAFVSGLSYELACARWPLAAGSGAAAALAPATRQIARELTAAMDRWLPLVPSMGIACDREAWAARLAGPGEREDREPAGVRGRGSAGVAAALLPSSDLRLTFDDRLVYCDCHECRASGAVGAIGAAGGSAGRGAAAASDSWRPIIGASASILEIKSAGPYPLWLVAVLSARGLYPASFTKYGTAYQMAALHEEGPQVAKSSTFALPQPLFSVR